MISSRRIQTRIRELAHDITQHYQGKPLTIIGLLHGSIFFLTDLMRQMPYDVQIECWKASSYVGKQSTGKITGLKDYQKSYQGRHILVVDDILDTGLTLTETVKHLEHLEAEDIRTCVLLVKDIKRQNAIVPDWQGFEIQDQFVVGYGLDHNGAYRPLSMIRALD